MVDSFLTDKQKKVLELRKEGLTQEEISEIIGTSRSNVSLIEKRARENLDRSKETIEDWTRLLAPIEIVVREGTDVLDIPELVYDEANREEIKVDLSTIDVVEKVKERASEFISNRVVKSGFKLYVSEDGDVLVEEDDSS